LKQLIASMRRNTRRGIVLSTRPLTTLKYGNNT